MSAHNTTDPADLAYETDREQSRAEKRPAWADRCHICDGYGRDEADGAPCRECEATGLNLRARMTKREGY